MSKFIDFEFANVYTWDYPDFCDAYIVDANFEDDNGNIRRATSEELDKLNEDSSLVYELVIEHLY